MGQSSTPTIIPTQPSSAAPLSNSVMISTASLFGRQSSKGPSLTLGYPCREGSASGIGSGCHEGMLECKITELERWLDAICGTMGGSNTGMGDGMQSPLSWQILDELVLLHFRLPLMDPTTDPLIIWRAIGLLCSSRRPQMPSFIWHFLPHFLGRLDHSTLVFALGLSTLSSS